MRRQLELQRWPQEVRLGARRVGEGHSVLVIAEIGSNHDGELATALELVAAAAEAGADAVKVQSFLAERLAAPGRLREALRPHELPRRWLEPLVEAATERGVLFLCTPFDEETLDFVCALGVPAIKIASGDLTHVPLLERAARSGLPILLSTGLATLAEVEEALAVLRRAGAREVVLFHCVSLYPPTPADLNLRAMVTMARATGCPVGFSDHCPSNAPALASVALGACAIEKHLTLDRRRQGPDHPFALEPAELAALVAGVRSVEAALGDGQKDPRPAEQPERYWARRGLYARAAIPRGATIRSSDLLCLRPCAGPGPADLAQVVGRRAARGLEAGQALAWEDIEPTRAEPEELGGEVR